MLLFALYVNPEVDQGKPESVNAASFMRKHTATVFKVVVPAVVSRQVPRHLFVLFLKNPGLKILIKKVKKTVSGRGLSQLNSQLSCVLGNYGQSR